MNTTATIFHQAQKEIAKDRHRFRVVCCGRRFGKTIVAINEIAAMAFSKKASNDPINHRIAYIAPTYQQARDIAWQELKKVTRPIAENVNESRLEVTVKTVDGKNSLIWLRGWENIETLRGQKFDFVVIDEVASMRNFWLNWQEVIRPTLTDTKGQGLFISTPKGFNHFYELYNKERTDEDYKSFHYSSYDNPHLPHEEIDKAKKELTEDRFAQEYMADFRKAEGLVYKEFDRKIHTYDDKYELPEFKEKILGVDFGFRNPTSILKIEIDREDNYWITDEWYKTEQTTARIIEKCKGFTPNMVYPDPAEPDRISEMTSEGLNVREVVKDVTPGINRVKEMFKQGRIKISQECLHLISELEQYHYKEWRNQDLNEPEQPEKKDDHAVDALRYALYSHEPAEEVLEQDFNIYNQQYD